MPKGIVVYGTAWCGDCFRAKRVFQRLGVDYAWVDLDEHPEAAAVVTRINNGLRSVPTIVFPDGSTLTEPADSVLEQTLRRFAAPT
jgi:mycoredoxin